MCSSLRSLLVLKVNDMNAAIIRAKGQSTRNVLSLFGLTSVQRRHGIPSPLEPKWMCLPGSGEETHELHSLISDHTDSENTRNVLSCTHHHDLPTPGYNPTVRPNNASPHTPPSGETERGRALDPVNRSKHRRPKIEDFRDHERLRLSDDSEARSTARCNRSSARGLSRSIPLLASCQFHY